MNKKIRVRIAPSPTGFAHVGTAYTALFNYAFAKNQGGKFIIRIEDSDLKRNIPGAEEKIYEALSWLGISWDEGTAKGGKYGPYRVSERLEIYRKRAKELIKKGMAYEDNGAIRFKNPGEDITWDDLVRGEITFSGGEITDFVMLKSDGYPTYNFNVVVDDSSMKISHVIRGEDHISNTPRQIALYKAFGYEIPEFAHHPLLLNKDRKKLSKRDAAVDVFEYKKSGYLPEAFVNFLCLLGWSHPNEKEIFDLSEFVELFSLGRVRKAGPIFNIDKLDWMNKQYLIKKAEKKPEEFVSFASKASIYSGEPNFKEVALVTATVVAQRIDRFQEYDNMVKPYYETPANSNRGKLSDNKKVHLEIAAKILKSLKEWEEDKINKSLLEAAKANDYSLRDFFMDLRIALTDEVVGVPLDNLIANLERKEALNRIEKLI